MKKLQNKELKALLVIVIGLNIFSVYYSTKPLPNASMPLAIASIAIGVISLIIPTIGIYVVRIWYKIAEVLGWINSRIILTLIFFLLLFPISLLYRIFNKDPLKIKRQTGSTMFSERNHQYEAKDFENMW